VAACIYGLLGYCHLWQYPTTKQVVAPLVPLMVAWFKALLTPPCWQMCWRGSPCLPIKEAIIWEQSEESAKRIVRENVSVSREKERAVMAAAVRAADVILLLHVSLYLIQWLSPVDVGGFAEPRKILCQCALPSYEQISVHPRSAHGVPELPNMGC
jgi:hypothetical protein